METATENFVVSAEQLLSVARSFDVDRLFEATVERRSGSTWAISQGGRCLMKDGEWDWEPSPSERDDAFLEKARFASAQEATAFYLKWRSQFYFLAITMNDNERWHLVMVSKSLEEIEKDFDYMKEAKAQHGCLVLIAPDRSILKTYTGTKRSPRKFIDFPERD